MVALECTPDRNLLLMNSSASKMKRSIACTGSSSLSLETSMIDLYQVAPWSDNGSIIMHCRLEIPLMLHDRDSCHYFDACNLVFTQIVLCFFFVLLIVVVFGCHDLIIISTWGTNQAYILPSTLLVHVGNS